MCDGGGSSGEGWLCLPLRVPEEELQLLHGSPHQGQVVVLHQAGLQGPLHQRSVQGDPQGFIVAKATLELEGHGH